MPAAVAAAGSVHREICDVVRITGRTRTAEDNHFDLDLDRDVEHDPEHEHDLDPDVDPDLDMSPPPERY